MDWDAIAAGARGEGAAYDKKRKARAKEREEAEHKRLAAEKWHVSVTVHSATVYLSTDSNGLSDPYAEVFVGDPDAVLGYSKIGSTKTKSKTMSPTWEETFETNVTGLDTAVKIKLYDKDMIASSYLGSWKSTSHTTGGKIEICPKGNNKQINAHVNITVTWTKKS